MKVIKIVFFLSISLLTMSSCEDYLVEDPKGLVAPDNFYENKTQLEQATLGAYAIINDNAMYAQGWNNLASGINDQITVRSDLLPNNTFAGGLGDGINTWEALYKGIRNVNELINGINDSPVNEEVKRPYLGEAYFLRGFYYMHLVLPWGGVPLVLENMSLAEIEVLPRSEETVVWDQIINDLNFAANNAPESFSDNLKSRATQLVAKSLLSRVYLYTEDWSNAATVAGEVINAGTYNLEPNFADVWTNENEQGQEVVFSVEFLWPNITTNLRRRRMPPGDVEGEPWFGWLSKKPTEDPEKGLASMFEENDERKHVTVTDINPFTNEPWLRQHDDPSIRTWYFGSKLWDLDNFSSGRDIFIIRYAEVLLNYAEAVNEANGGPTGNAYEAINRVRARAGLEPLDSNLTQQEFREAVRQERSVELAGESLRRWDLRRWGIFTETFKNMSTVDVLPLAIENFQDYMTLHPIPSLELAKNPNLEQNPGY